MAGRRIRREGDDERRALAHLALHLHLGLVHADDLLADGQPQPRAWNVPGMGFIRFVEPLPDIGDVLLGDAVALVRHRQHRTLLGVWHHLEPDHGRIRGILHGVVPQDHHQLIQPVPVAVHQQLVVHVLLQPDVPFLGPALQHAAYALHDLAQGDGFHLFALAPLQPADVQQFLDEPLQPLGLVVDQVAVFLHILRIGDGAVRQGLVVALDDGDGCAQLVAYIGHEIPAHLLHLPALQHELLQVTAQGIQAAAQVGDLVVAVHRHLQGIVPGGDGFGRVLHGDQGLHHAPAEPADDHHADAQGDDPHDDGVQVDVLQYLVQAAQGRSQQHGTGHVAVGVL